MIIITGSTLGNGKGKKILTRHRPLWVGVKTDSANGMVHSMRTMWCGRSNNLFGAESFNNGVQLLDDGFYIGNVAKVNTLNVKTYWIAICEDNDGADVLATGHYGNATDNQVYDYPMGQIAMAMIKRDSARAPAIRISGAIDALTDSTGTGVDGAYIKSLGIGQITVSNSVNVNELDGVNGIGEGHETLLIGSGYDVETFTWTGDGTTNRNVVTAANEIRAAFIYRQTTGGGSMRVKTVDMSGGYTAPVSAAALQDQELFIVSNKLTTGTSLALNTNGVQYACITFKKKNEKAIYPKSPAIKLCRGDQGIYLPGRTVTSYIDCGTSDGSLMISGPITVEWTGILYHHISSQNTEHGIFMRGGGSYSNANSTSWGIDGFRSADSTFAWGGPQAHICVADRFGNTTEVRPFWRTGEVIPNAELCQLTAVHRGNGVWYFYIDGKLVRQRKLDLSATSLALTNINSQSGHKTTIGCRYVASGPTYTGCSRMIHKNARVYARALSHDEVATRAEIELKRSSLTDITDFAEEWNSANAGGLLLPATVSSVNNGTIVLGRVMTL